MQDDIKDCEECGISKNYQPDCDGLYCCRTSDGSGECNECERCMCECHSNDTPKFNQFMFCVESIGDAKKFFSEYHQAAEYYEAQFKQDDSLTIWLVEAEPSFFFWEFSMICDGFWDYEWDDSRTDLCKLIYKIK